MFVGSSAVEASVNTVLVVIVLKGHQLSLQITSAPERNLVEIFSTNGCDKGTYGTVFTSVTSKEVHTPQ